MPSPRRRFTIRPVTPEDAPAGDEFYRRAGTPLAGPLELMLQTGNAFLAAYDESGALQGLVRHWDDEGIAWWDLLVSNAPGAGRALARGVESRAQDRGLRLVRLEVPDAGRLVNLFHRWGYRTVGHTKGDGGETMAVLEKRLALLTVREQRRTDADAIAEVTGEDAWVYSQGARPGAFIAADGDRVVGFIAVRDAGAGQASISAPALLAEYRGRGLELWMIERAATYAETNGYHTAELAALPGLDAIRRALEDRHWHREGDRYLRRFRDLDTHHEDD
jgi:ribosomal protein S18 acetylase RimI-like enzyme